MGGRIDIEFLGGASEIGASCALVTVGGTRLLVDCGVRFEADNPLPDLASLGGEGVDAVLVTHAHSDHTGGLPVVADACPDAKVYATPPTIDLTRILLRDALKLMDIKEELTPLYTQQQAERLIESLVPVQHGASVTVGEVEVTFLPASHILGAAMLFLQTPAGAVVFTGDFSVSSQLTVPALGVPAVRADMVVCEATYGDRMHEDREAAERRLVAAVAGVVEAGGKVLVPAFAVGRAQEVLLVLKRALRNRSMPEVPVWVDGMVRAVCEVYGSHERYVTRHLAHEIRTAGHPFHDRWIRPVSGNAEREEALGPDPCVIVASSGMLSGGASVYHAERMVSGECNAILITGYQDEESPGRALLALAAGQGERTLRLGTRTVEVKCRVEKYALSAHADRMQTAGVIAAFEPTTVVLVHGNEGARGSLAGAVMARDVVLPGNGEVVSRGFMEARAGGGSRRGVEITLDEARKLLGPPTGVMLRARALADIWCGPGAGRGQVEALVENLEALGVARRDDARRGFVHVLAPSESDALADEAVLELELKRENPKGRLLELCMRMGVEPPVASVVPDGEMHSAVTSMTVAGDLLEVGPVRAAAKKTAEQLACRELLTLLEERSAVPETREVPDEEAAALRARNPKGRLLEWCASSRMPGPRFDSQPVPDGYLARGVLDGRAASGWYRASSIKVAEQAASAELLEVVESGAARWGAAQTPAPAPAARPALRDPRMLLNELRQKAVIADFGYEIATDGGPDHMTVFSVIGRATLAGGRVVSTEAVQAMSKKEGQARAAATLVELLQLENLVGG